MTARERRHITAWMGTAITLEKAEREGYRQIGRITMLRNWSKREELWAHHLEAKQAKPVLVLFDPDGRKGALFATV